MLTLDDKRESKISSNSTYNSQHLPEIHDECHLHERRDIGNSQYETMSPKAHLNPSKSHPKWHRTKKGSYESSNREICYANLHGRRLDCMDVCSYLKKVTYF